MGDAGGDSAAADDGTDMAAGADADAESTLDPAEGALLATASLAMRWVTSWQTQLWMNGYEGERGQGWGRL